MQKKRWNRIETILDTALTLTGDERTTYVIDACGKDNELLTEVYELLDAIEESEKTNFLEGVLSENSQFVKNVSDSDPIFRESFIGAKIGAFKITEKLGSGGMGAVYKGERSDGRFTQIVAIKLLQQEIQTEETLRRFRMEQEILAALKHPHIAQLHDGGITGDGIPYLVMEYVDGIPIDRYCNKHTLTVDQRIALFTDVCRAVQFAHSNLVIHRDLKAQNIYVTAEGTVKVLDFGIAKLLNPKLSEQTLLETKPGQKLWTPQYAAPEQVKGEPVTTATDVYGLGVLLHRLLTDTYPLDLKNKSLLEVEHIIAEKTPRSPSDFLTECKEPVKVAELRQASAADLKKTLAGDLDAVVLKALRKEPEYRYNSVGQLLEELDRYQDELPLMARKGTVRYRIGKFMRRHKTGITVSALIFLLIISLSAFYTWRIAKERDTANIQAEKAEMTAQFLTSLFTQSSPQHAQKANMTAREILDAGAENIFGQLKDQPVVRAKVLSVIGQAYLNIDQLLKADSLVSLALKIYERQSTIHNSNDLAYSKWVMGKIKLKLGNYVKAKELIRSALMIYKKNEGKDSREVKQCLLDLALILHEKTKYTATNAKISDWSSVNPDEAKEERATRLLNEGQIALIRGHYKEAEEKTRISLELRKKLYGEFHAFTAIAMDRLSSILAQGRYYNPEAESLQSKAVFINNIVYDEPHTEWAYSIFNLARLKYYHGDYSEATKLYRQAIVMMQKVRGAKSPYTLNFKFKYANLLVALNKLDQARKLYQELEQIYTQKYDKEYLYSIRCRARLASILGKENKLHEAAKLFRRVINEYDTKYGQIHKHSISSRLHYAHILLKLGKKQEAKRWIDESLNFLRQSESEIKWELALAKQILGLLRMEQQRFTEAEKLLKNSSKIIEQIFGLKNNYTKKSLGYLVNLYEAWGKPDKANHYRTVLVENTKK